MASMKLILFTTMAIMLVSSPPFINAAITCGQVANSVSKCLNYLVGTQAIVPPACCGGIRSLNNMATTTPDRQQACRCLKSLAQSFSGKIKPDLAAGLPGKCGVNIPYKISTSTNCDQVR